VLRISNMVGAPTIANDDDVLPKLARGNGHGHF
jgi:hypothetical protein